jgi:hypothetical protein
MRVRGVTIAVVLVLALMGASCGSDDSETAGDTESVMTETEGITAEDTTTGETTDDDGPFDTAECSSLVAAAASVATSFSATGDTGEVEEARAQFEEFADEAPDEIRDDLQVLVDAYDEFAEVLDDVDIEPGETPTAEAIQELQAAIASIDQAEVAAAAANVNTWTTANC